MAETDALKDSYLETRLFQARLITLAIIILAMVAVLVVRYFTLQIVHYENFATRSEANRILTQIIPPTRGLILDRQGILLADSKPSFSLNIVQERTQDLDKTILELQNLLGISDDEVKRFHKRNKKRSRRPYQSVPLRYRLSDLEMAQIAVNEWRLPGVEVAAQLVRHYPLGKLTAHNIGYVGSINEKDIANLVQQNKWQQYEGVVYSIGKLGIEKIYEHDLFGIGGTRKVEVNAQGQVLREINKQPPIPGKNFRLFLDAEIQALAHKKLRDQRGAVVAIETNTGGVITAASTPAFDPNLFVTGISSKQYNALRDDWQLPLFNRLSQGQYPPASTLKPIMGLAGLNEEVITAHTTIFDPGYFQLPNDDRLYRNWKREGHGHVNLRKAIAQSSDTYFYKLGVDLTLDRIAPFFAEFGLGHKTGVDLTYERPGLLPTREWKKQHYGRAWFAGDTVNLSIGQGDMLVTPMQLAYMTTIIANRGERLTPRMVEAIDDSATPKITAGPKLELQQQENWDHVIKGMIDVVQHPTGTAKHLGDRINYRMAGKTGTAQVIGIKQDEEYDRETVALRNRDHALFIAFAPVKQPRIAVAVIVENGESGSTAAAPIAEAVISAYLKKYPQATGSPPAKGV